jgi:plasmid stabilization system protein ParE
LPDRRRFKVIYAPRVAAQIDVAHTWWRRNRLAAPSVLVDELDAALDLLAQTPAAGRRVALRGYQRVRRLLLRRASYHLYYQVDIAGLEVRLLAFRHTRRRPPRP